MVAVAAAIGGATPELAHAQTTPSTASLASPGARGVSFELNQGQANSAVKFLTRNAQYPLFLTTDSAVFVLTDPQTVGDPTKLSGPIKGDVVSLTNAGANSNVQMTGLDPVPGKTNYLNGKDKGKWHTGITSYARVQYTGIYPGVDLVYYGTAGGAVEYEYVVAPGADAGVIASDVAGANHVSVDRNGALSITTSVGTITEHKPTVYQTINGKKKPVSGGYRSLAGNRVGFSIGNHDTSQPVVIDPVLSYSTYLGGNIGQNIGSPGTSTAVDSSGHQYVVGYTFAPDFPTTPGAFQTSKFGDPTSSNFQNTLNAFITKFSPDGSSLVYSTYLGGTGKGFFTGDYGYGIAVDGAGDAFVTGATTSDDFPVTGNAAQPNRGTTCTTCFNAYLTELNPSGSSLVYSSYLGGHSNNGGRNEGGRSVAVDAGGHVYVAGLSQSSDFPTTANALQRTCPSECAVNTDGVSTSGSSTYTSAGAFFFSFDAGSSISGTNIPANSCINTVIDATTITLGDCAGNAVNATGTGSGLTFTMGSRSRVQMGFFARFDPAASGTASLTYSTLLGGGGDQTNDGAYGVAVDDAGEAYVTGTALSYDFPTTGGAFQTTCRECSIHTDGVTQSGSTTFTSSSAQFGPFDVGDRVDGVNIPAGTTVANVVSPTQLTLSAPAEAGGTGLKYHVGFSRAGDAFVAKLNPAASGPASLVFGTLLGGAGGVDTDTGFILGGTIGAGIAVDPSRRTVYVTGTTDSFDFPTTSGVISRVCGGGSVLPCGKFPTFSDGVTTAGSTTLTSASANFQGNDQFVAIAGINLAPGTTIAAVVNSTTVTLSQAATGTGTASFELEDRVTPSDQFVTQLDPSGGSLTYSTFLGGPSSQIGASQATGQTGGGVAIDAAGDAYITGLTTQPDFPLRDPVAAWGGGKPPDPGNNWPGADDVTVSELAPNAKSLVYSTTLGGNSLDEPAGIVVDSSGAAYVTGNTKSSNFPTTPTAFKPVYGGRVNAFAAKIAPVSATLPLITAMSATHGPTGGGTSDVLTGHGFTGTTAVSFGGVPAAFHVDSATQITATSPPQPNAISQMDVSVTTPAGASPANPVDRFDQGDGQWTAAQPLSDVRDGPTATLLKNGKVLVVGGNSTIGGANEPNPAAELYDPAAGTWAPTDSPNDARGLGSIATLLSDGRVLVIGKAMFFGDKSAEIYDPGMGHWTTVASANADHTDGAAVLLADGRVLAVGGDTNISSEVYDPVANTWTALPAPVSSGFNLVQPSLTRLNDGRVLLAGGSGGAGFSMRATAEIFDPSANTWSATGSMNVPHADAASVLLSDGRLLVAGGQQTRGVEAVAAEEIFDPASGSWSLSGLLHQPRSGATATLLPNGKVLIAGGLVESDDLQSGPLDTAELFDPAAPLQQGIADDLISPRGESTPQTTQQTFRAVLLSSDVSSFKSDPAVCGTNCGKVLVVGGSYDNSAELYSSIVTPMVTSVSPSTGSSLGGATVTIRGPGMTGATAVNFGSTPAQSFTVINDSTIQAVSPVLAPGAVEITVTALGGTSTPCGCAADRFTTSAPSFATQDVVSTKQYALANSDGNTWQPLACSGATTCSSSGTGNAIAATLSPSSSGDASLTVNTDLWTQNAGYNQDIGLFVNGSLAAWKESGGSAGTFSPNAAALQAEIPVTGGQVYNVDVRWKTNKPTTSGVTIQAGAGPIGTDFSPTRLSTVLMPASAVPAAATSTHQFMLTGSDGSTWVPMACSGSSTSCSSAGSGGLTATVTPSTDGVAVFGFNTDLWTENAGFNQDVAIFVNGVLAGWKESGGSAGQFSPNAAFLQVRYPVSGGQTYHVDVRWKANKADGGTIAAGAGPIGGAFSPSMLTSMLLPAGSNPFSAVSTRQFSLHNSDGSTWQPISCSGGATTCSSSGSGDAMTVTVTPNQNCVVLLTGNADLWTDTSGFNQDIGIFVNGTLVGWKESGGSAGTFSPNAAFVQVVQTFTAGTAYTVDLRWKSNQADSGGIDAGAGPSGPFSPTSLLANFTSCS